MAGKISKWQEKLLDLSKRNKLLYYKQSQTASLEVIAPAPDTVYEKLMSKARLKVFELDAKCGEGGKSKDKDKAKHITAAAAKEFFAGAIKSGEILLYNFAREINVPLANLEKNSKAFLIERGINALYTAFGFLDWKDAAGERNYSPILLVPVSLSREKANAPYTVELFEDETVINPALKYKLHSDYKIALPEMTDTDTAVTYCNKVADAVAELGVVSHGVELSLFSYNKVNMYLDLKNNAGAVEESGNIAALIGEPPKEDASITPFAEGLHNVVDADISQTEAILYAKTGKSFVLQGPPGTGKSQTITNLIAEYLANGKKVLFVSEKLAALDVVFNNLKKVGLSDYALELHSHKANKKDCIDELIRTLKLPQSVLTRKAREDESALKEITDRLAAYADFMHAETKTGLTPFEMAVKVCGRQPAVSYIFKDLESRDALFIAIALDAFRTYAEYTLRVGTDYRKNVWYGFSSDPDYEQKAQLRALLDRACEGLICAQKAQEVLELIGFKADNIDKLRVYAEFFESVYKNGVFYGGFYDKAKHEPLVRKFAHLARLKEKIVRTAAELSVFTEEFLQLPAADTLRRFAGYKGVFKKFSAACRKDTAKIRSYLKQKTKLSFDSATRYLFELKKYQDCMDEFNKASIGLSELAGERFDGLDTDFDGILKVLSGAAAFADKIDLSPLFRLDRASVEKMLPLLRAFSNKFSEFADYAGTVADLGKQFARTDFSSAPLADALTKAQGCKNGLDNLPDYLSLRKLLSRISDAGLSEFLHKCIDADVPPHDISAIFEHQIYTQWLYALLSKHPVLANTGRVEHDKLIADFQRMDSLSFEAAKAKINAQLSAVRPKPDMIVSGGQASVLLREGEKKRRQMPVRVLFERISDIIFSIKPCMLMSPLSVSTYLGPDIKFDVVIFDEASQVFPEDALGALYRAKQAIIVGDSKQMPPSDFFTAAAGGGEDEEESDLTDFESVLDIASASFHGMRLKWHYRSRAEALINFSNTNFYNSELMTFPAAIDLKKDFGVEFYHIPDGRFDRRVRQNPVEAETVADLVFENFRRHPERSVGVVAFSISQADAIERAVNARRERNRGFEDKFTGEIEPFFIKNLETVQGDERDTIILSVAYGYDAAGKFLHNFGPLNRVGGERRLNVAITRAKFNTKVVSSVLPSDFDLSKTESRGAALLKNYLEYCAGGGKTPENAGRAAEGLCKEVLETLNDFGYRADALVGSSKYPVDIAVIHPKTGQYFMAVECDGKEYFGLKSVRDRDRLRANILQRYNWEHYRIFAADWFRNKKSEIERLKDALVSALAGAQSRTGGDSEEEYSVAPQRESAFAFYDHFNIDNIIRNFSADGEKAVLTKICESEAPVALAYLAKRTLSYYNLKKASDVHAAGIAAKLWSWGFVIEDGFVYFPLKKTYIFRAHREGEPVREIEYISPEEIAEGMYSLISTNPGITTDGLYLHTAKLLGFKRAGDNIAARFGAALSLLTSSGRVGQNGDVLEKL